jgi:hypothetical protein
MIYVSIYVFIIYEYILYTYNIWIISIFISILIELIDSSGEARVFKLGRH